MISKVSIISIFNIFLCVLLSNFLFMQFLVNNIGTDIIAAYNMMLDTITEYLDNSNYFTIEFKRSLVDYEYRVDGDKKMSWKEFFADTYAEEEKLFN